MQKFIKFVIVLLIALIVGLTFGVFYAWFEIKKPNVSIVSNWGKKKKKKPKMKKGIRVAQFAKTPVPLAKTPKDDNIAPPPELDKGNLSDFSNGKKEPGKKGGKDDWKPVIDEKRSPAADLEIDNSRRRDLAYWKPAIRNYSQRHYKQYTYKLDPKVIVLHYTGTNKFPYIFSNSKRYAGETPGVACHYVVDGTKIWRILPDNIRSRGCWGINHVGINIEMIASSADDLAGKTETLNTCAKLVKYLMDKHNIPASKIYSHELVGKMNKKLTPEVLDYVNGTPYKKVDPGEKNMQYIKDKVKDM